MMLSSSMMAIAESMGFEKGSRACIHSEIRAYFICFCWAYGGYASHVGAFKNKMSRVDGGPFRAFGFQSGFER